MRNFSINIGHPAYQGLNAQASASSIAHAIDILRTRGAKRDDARRAVRAALRGSWSVCKLNNFDSCEVTASQETQDAYQFWHLISDKDRAYLRDRANFMRANGMRVGFYVC